MSRITLTISNKLKVRTLTCKDLKANGAVPDYGGITIAPGQSFTWACFDDGFSLATFFAFPETRSTFDVGIQYHTTLAENNCVWVSGGDTKWSTGGSVATQCDIGFLRYTVTRLATNNQPMGLNVDITQHA